MFRRSHAREHYDVSSSPSKYKVTKARKKAIGLIDSMHVRWQPCARCVLWALLAACVICFWSIIFVRPTGWYRDDTGGHFRAVWEALELPSRSGAENAGTPIMAGMVSTQVCSVPRRNWIMLSHLPSAPHAFLNHARAPEAALKASCLHLSAILLHSDTVTF